MPFHFKCLKTEKKRKSEKIAFVVAGSGCMVVVVRGTGTPRKEVGPSKEN